MKPICAQAVNAAAGRELTDAELARVESSIDAASKRLAKADVDRWRGLSADQRTVEAGIQAVKDMKAEAQLKKYRGVLQVLKTAETENRIGQLRRIFSKAGRNKALVKDMQNTANYIAGVKDEAISSLHDLLEATKSGEDASFARKTAMFLFDTENPQMSRDLALEVFRKADGSTGNKLAKKGAEAWLRTIEPLRQRFNAAGGDVGKLLYGYLPTLHDATKVLNKGKEAWADAVMPMLDRKQYLNADGSAMGDGQVRDFLRASWDTISTEGQNKTEPGQFTGTGSRANKGSNAREIHFKDGANYIDYLAQFGRGSMYEAMVGHINGMARDIGLVERYGPNPETQMRLQQDLAAREDGGAKYVAGNTPEGYWNVLSGTASVPQNVTIARVGSAIRAINTAGKLGSALISSLTDLHTFVNTTGYNNLSYLRAIANVGRGMTAETKEWMAMHGIIGESMIGDLNRWSGDHIKSGVTARLAQSTLKLSGLNLWTDTLRNAFQLTMMNGMAKLSKTAWAELSPFDRFRMEQHGVTEADWQVIQQAKLESHKGMEFLSPDAIRASEHPDAPQVASKVLGLIKDEGETAVINPDLATKTLQTWGGTQAGSVKGELARSVMQFKSFPIAMISRHWRRMLEAPNIPGRPISANPLVYGTSMAVSLMGLGAIVLQAKQIAAGKDPIAMNGEHAGKFWLAAMAQGGAASILGDMLLKDTTQGGTGFASTTGQALLGPGIGSALDALAVIKDNVDKKIKGQPTHTGANLLRVARQDLPYVNLWYAKAAMDHAGINAMQESLSPGYLAKQKAQAQKDWGQSYWWQPGTGGPQRAPDLSRAWQ